MSIESKTLKQIIQESKTVHFIRYCQGELWYETEAGRQECNF
ncbi:MAG: hypothetical protein ACXW2E_01265 [Nitrososphaeraceae archaeon]